MLTDERKKQIEDVIQSSVNRNVPASVAHTGRFVLIFGILTAIKSASIQLRDCGQEDDADYMDTIDPRVIAERFRQHHNSKQ